MMSIRVVSRGGEALGVPLRASFGDAGGDIGRGSDCTLVLPDPQRRISRKHALVSCRDGCLYIRQIGANLNVEMNGTPLAPGLEHALFEGASLRIGHYLLQVDADADAGAGADDRTSALLDTPPGAPAAGLLRGVLADVLGDVPGDDGGVDLLLDETAPPERLLQSLYEGLGVAPPAAPSPEQLRLVGALLRAALDGTLRLLAARSVAKREFGAEATLLQTRENNPLKFMPDANAALAHLLGPAQRGFVTPLAAIDDAFADLRAHELAVLAGMRAALDAMLARFDPAVLEPRLAPPGRWPALAASRKARLWERYAEEYAQLVQEVENDLEPLFGRAFLQAYQAQLAQLARAGR